MASTSAAIQTGLYLYLYGITSAKRGTACPLDGMGGAPVETIVEGSLAAVVSDVNDAQEAIPILGAVARKCLATETSGTIKVTQKARAAGRPAHGKDATAR